MKAAAAIHRQVDKFIDCNINSIGYIFMHQKNNHQPMGNSSIITSADIFPIYYFSINQLGL